jgi:hypothetical protein
MKLPRFYLVISVLSLLTLLSCKRNDDVNFTVENLSSKQMNVALYASLSDYNNSTNAIMTGIAKVRGYWVIPMKKLTQNKMYYIDVYSDDYLYNNWYVANAVLSDSFTATNHDTRFTVYSNVHNDYSMLTWLNGLGPQTTWKAFNAYNYSGGSYTSIWATLPATEQNVQLVINKSCICKLTTGGGLDSTLNLVANYDTTTHKTTAKLLTGSGGSYGTLSANFNTGTFAFDASKDTILAYFSGLGYFAMARQ